MQITELIMYYIKFSTRAALGKDQKNNRLGACTCSWALGLRAGAASHGSLNLSQGGPAGVGVKRTGESRVGIRKTLRSHERPCCPAVWEELASVVSQDREMGIKKKATALAGVAQWIECGPANHSVAGLIPSQDTCLSCRSGLQ